MTDVATSGKRVNLHFSLSSFSTIGSGDILAFCDPFTSVDPVLMGMNTLSGEATL